MLFKKKNIHKQTFLKRKQSELAETIDLYLKLSYDISIKSVYIVIIGLVLIGILVGILFKSKLIALICAIGIPLISLELFLTQKRNLELTIERQIIAYAELIKNSFLSTKSVLITLQELTPKFDDPVRTVFEECITDISIFNISTEKSLQSIMGKLNFISLHELINQLILCDKDSRYITSLETTTKYLADKRAFLQQWEFKVDNIKKMYLTIIAIINGIVIWIYLTMGDMMDIFMESKASIYIIAIYLGIQFLVTYKTLSKIKSIKI